MAVTQKPRAVSTTGPAHRLGRASRAGIVSTRDRMIPPETETWTAERIGPKKTITLEATHASLASHPDDVVALIDEAGRTFE